MAGIFQPEISQQSAPPGYSGRTYFADVGAAIGRGLEGLGGMVENLGKDNDDAFLSDIAGRLRANREAGAQKGWSETRMQTNERLIISQGIQSKPGLVDDIFKIGRGTTGVDYGSASTPEEVTRTEALNKLTAPGGALSGARAQIVQEEGAKNVDGSVNEDYIQARLEEKLSEYNVAATRISRLQQEYEQINTSGQIDTERHRQINEDYRRTLKPLVQDAVDSALAMAKDGLETIGGRTDVINTLRQTRAELEAQYGKDSGFAAIPEDIKKDIFAPIDNLISVVDGMSDNELKAYAQLDAAAAEALNQVLLENGLIAGKEGRTTLTNSLPYQKLLAESLLSGEGRKKAENSFKNANAWLKSQVGSFMIGSDDLGFEADNPTTAEAITSDQRVGSEALHKQMSTMSDSEKKSAARLAIQNAVTLSDAIEMGETPVNNAVYESFRQAIAVSSSSGVERVGFRTMESILGTPGFAKALQFASTNQTPEAMAFLADTTRFIKAQTAIRKNNIPPNIENITAGLPSVGAEGLRKAFELTFESGVGEVVINRETLLSGGMLDKLLVEKMDAGGYSYDLDGIQAFALDSNWAKQVLNLNPSVIMSSMGTVKTQLEDINKFQKMVTGLPQDYLESVYATNDEGTDLSSSSPVLTMEDTDESISAILNAPDGTLIKTEEYGVVEKGSDQWYKLIGEGQ